MPVRACERVTKRFGALSDVDQPSFAADGYESLGFLASVYSVDQLIYRFSEGLSSYRSRDWKTAIQCFEAALEVQPQDEPSRIYLSRCRHYQQNPPADDWTGIWVLNEK